MESIDEIPPPASDPITEDREDTDEVPGFPSAEERDANTPRNSPEELDSIIASPISVKDEESIITESKYDLKQNSNECLSTVNEDPSKEAEEDMAAEAVIKQKCASMDEELTMDNSAMSQDGDYPDNAPAFCGCFV